MNDDRFWPMAFMNAMKILYFLFAVEIFNVWQEQLNSIACLLLVELMNDSVK